MTLAIISIYLIDFSINAGVYKSVTTIGKRTKYFGFHSPGNGPCPLGRYTTGV